MQTAASPSPAPARANILTRDDTFFGVCQAIGEDFGIPPNLLRVALAVALFWSPVAVICTYAAAGVVVALSRWMAPDPAFAEASAGEPVETSAAPVGDNDREAEALAA